MTLVRILEFVGILIVLIILHEMGHMFVARRCGMRVERFSVFFGRPLWSVRRGETEYAVGWLPLGGYVKITGMTREELVTREYDAEGRLVSETPMPPEVQARAYCNATTPRKVATIAAGPAANVLVAIVLFALSFWIGTPIYERSATIGAIAPDRPAALAGLQAGDRVVAVNDVQVGPDGSMDAVAAELERNVGRPVTVVYVRDGERASVTTAPLVPDAADARKGRIGVVFEQQRAGTEREGLAGGIAAAVRFTGFLTKEQVVALGRIFTDETVREQVSGPIGIGATYNEFAEEGIGTILRFAGIISLILAIMNLIPLLPLDGGHIVFALAERIRGKQLSFAVYQRASIVGIALVMILALYAVNNDIDRLTGEGFRP